MTKNRIIVGVIVSGVLIGGCKDVQSVLVPKGPGAAQIAQLSWIMFAFAAVVLIIVEVASWFAIRGSDAVRARLAATTAVLVGGAAFPVLTLTVLLGYGVWLTHANVRPPGDENAVRIEVVGEQWWWRVAYPQPDGRSVASANEIRIPAGRAVDFVLTSTDVIHSFWVPNLGGKVDMIPGRTTQLRLVADQPDVFRGQCAEFCGGPHALMAFEVVAMNAVGFDAWITAQSAPAAEPTTPEAQRGKELFIAAGCGGCHAVRGTEATGTIGPDLTHIGSRRSVGIDTLPVTQANLARFIVEGQHVKPGNRMPPFRIFAEAELDALTTYLAGLR